MYINKEKIYFLLYCQYLQMAYFVKHKNNKEPKKNYKYEYCFGGQVISFLSLCFEDFLRDDLDFEYLCFLSYADDLELYDRADS